MVKYNHKQYQMQLLESIFNSLIPQKVSCNDNFDAEFPHDQAATEEDYSSIQSRQQRRKVRGFDHLLSPILGITGEHQFIKGFKAEVMFPFSQLFQVHQSWQIPNTGIKQEGGNPMMAAMMGRGSSKPTYTMTAQLAKDVVSPYDSPGLLLVSKFDNEGKVDGILLKRLANNLNLKLSANFMSSKTDDGALAADLQYSEADSELVFKLHHQPMQGQVFSFNYMQRVHRHLMLGFDFSHLFSQKRSLFSYGGKAFLGNHALYFGSIQGGSQYHLGYLIPIKKGTTFVSHYKFDPENGSSTTLGFKQRSEAFDITGTVSTKGKIMTIFQMKSQIYGLKLCAEVDYFKDHYSFGYGFSFGPQH